MGTSVFSNGKNSFELKETLLVLAAAENLIFVHKICYDNRRIMEFDDERVKMRNKSGRVIWKAWEMEVYTTYQLK